MLDASLIHFKKALCALAGLAQWMERQPAD